MKETIKRNLFITIYYIFISIIINKIVYFLWINYIFFCNIENSKDLDCIDIIFNSVMFSYSIVILFLIIDIFLLKSYKIIINNKKTWKNS